MNLGPLDMSHFPQPLDRGFRPYMCGLWPCRCCIKILLIIQVTQQLTDWVYPVPYLPMDKHVLHHIFYKSTLQRFDRDHSPYVVRYSCIAGLQFDWFGFNRFTTYKQQRIFLFRRTQSSKTGGQPFSDTSPYGVSVL